MRSTAAAMLVVLAAAGSATAQESGAAPSYETRSATSVRPSIFGAAAPGASLVHPTDVEVLLATQAVLHTADMITTSYALSFRDAAREANPVLAGLTRQPVGLSIASGAIDVLQAYTILKLQHSHPKIALWWARALVGVEVWTTINNINATSELQRAAR